MFMVQIMIVIDFYFLEFLDSRLLCSVQGCFTLNTNHNLPKVPSKKCILTGVTIFMLLGEVKNKKTE